jgi:hypothetical protein
MGVNRNQLITGEAPPNPPCTADWTPDFLTQLVGSFMLFFQLFPYAGVDGVGILPK